jgi:eukaryotic-like serine/threonine-protein kinase
MEISFRCPSCRVKLGVEVQYAGRSMYCPKCEEKVTIPQAGLGTWTTLGEYRLQKVVGEGSSGSVYLAQDRNMERDVAVKVFKPELTKDPIFLKKFLHEIKIIARLTHPNIVTAYKAGEDHNYHYLVMEYISGGTIEDHVIRHGVLDEKDALKIALLTAQALDYAWHKEQILHLDLKPENLMLNQNGMVKITDLGIARCLKDFDYEHTQEVSGTPAYMSPEQATGTSLDLRSDLFSLGGTLYFMLTGKAPFGNANVKDTLDRVINQELLCPKVFNKNLSEKTARLVKKMMHKDKSKRHQSWRDLVTNLKEELHSEPQDKKLLIRKHPTEPRIKLKTSNQKNPSK